MAVAALRRFLSVRLQTYSKRIVNRTQIASVDTPGAFQALGLLVKAGSAHETEGFYGSSFALEKLAFKATQSTDFAAMQSRLDKLVGSVSTVAGRDSLLYSGAVAPEQLSELFALLSEAISQPSVTQADIEELQQIAAYEVMELENKSEELLPEMIHRPAFGGTGFGRNIISLPESLKKLKPEAVMEFWKSHYVKENVIVVGAGIPEDALVDLVLTQSSLPNTHPFKPSANIPKYIGGEELAENRDLPLTHVAIGFEGIPPDHPDSYPLAVLHLLMGGGGSFSAGGPGKGMYSRLYTQVLNRYGWIESARIFNFSYCKTGVFGIHGSCLPSHADDLVKVLSHQLKTMDRSLTNIELLRARNQVKSALLMGLESRLLQLEDLAKQCHYLGVPVSVAEMINRIDAVDDRDIRRVCERLLKSRPTIMAYGPLHRLPAVDSIRSMFKE